MNIKQTLNDIQFDIDKGYYDHFEVLKSRMQHIANKLAKLIYISNVENLSQSEIKTLIENGYISEFD